MAAYGGFIGGLLAGRIFARRTGLPVWRLLGAAAPALLVGQIIGRLGCLANGTRGVRRRIVPVEWCIGTSRLRSPQV